MFPGVQGNIPKSDYFPFAGLREPLKHFGTTRMQPTTTTVSQEEQSAPVDQQSESTYPTSNQHTPILSG
jgi:hypothetical protein